MFELTKYLFLLYASQRHEQLLNALNHASLNSRGFPSFKTATSLALPVAVVFRVGLMTGLSAPSATASPPTARGPYQLGVASVMEAVGGRTFLAGEAFWSAVTRPSRYAHFLGSF